MTAKRVTPTMAKRAAKAIEDRFNPVVDGERFFASPIIRIEDDGRVEILWEEGPYEWPFAMQGDPTEEDFVLLAEVGMKPTPKPPVPLPKGVWAEPATHYSLALFRED